MFFDSIWSTQILLPNGKTHQQRAAGCLASTAGRNLSTATQLSSQSRAFWNHRQGLFYLFNHSIHQLFDFVVVVVVVVVVVSLF